MKKNNKQDIHQIEEEFSKWLVENKVNESIGVLIDTCVKYMDKPFYEWHKDWNPYDYSGDIRKLDTTNKEKCHTLYELKNAYTGERMASYTSHYGWHFETVEDVWEFEMLEKIFTPFLLEFIAINRDWLMSFKEIRRSVEDEEFREEYYIPKEKTGDDAIREYLVLEDIVGDSNIDLMCKLEEVTESIQEEIFNQIQERCNSKNFGGIVHLNEGKKL